eukprot:TRINITY_DN2491_c0_g2_i1.p2 TRINITY_DN2491_c0_g2~~TRINITY_DN2491_c0_g2_i1.p2  ORF type:complete len:111 (+),score=7.30 TRINITY_DN2491_c0_g2_i1:79-411(+)
MWVSISCLQTKLRRVLDEPLIKLASAESERVSENFLLLQNRTKSYGVAVMKSGFTLASLSSLVRTTGSSRCKRNPNPTATAEKISRREIGTPRTCEIQPRTMYLLFECGL